ncbi:MAG: class I SAM-dependent methyltransferase [Bdellovibrionales bacterium]
MTPGFYEFLKASLKSPLQTSTPFASGPRVGRRFARHVHLREDEILVELGVGSGSVTEHLLSRLSGPHQYVGFELNDDLYEYLHFEKYPHLEIHHDTAEHLLDVVKGRKVGAVISTLPWSLLAPPTRHSILSQVHTSLQPGGLFGLFLSLHVLWTPAVKDFWAQLTQTFPEYTYIDEMLNIPPCRLYFARKH